MERKVFGNANPHVTQSLDNLAYVLQSLGKLSEAEVIYRELLTSVRTNRPTDFTEIAGLLTQLASTLLAEEKFSEAQSPAEECVVILGKSLPTYWGTFYARSMLGGSLLGQKKYPQAELWLVSGYEGMKLYEKEIPPHDKPRLREAALRLVSLYEATGQSGKAAEWDKTFGTLNDPAKR